VLVEGVNVDGIVVVLKEGNKVEADDWTDETDVGALDWDLVLEGPNESWEEEGPSDGFVVGPLDDIVAVGPLEE
jgi:hypothetical protein